MAVRWLLVLLSSGSLARGATIGDEPLIPSVVLPATEPGPRAVLALRRDDWSQALDLAEQAYERRPDEARSHSLLGECVWRAGHLQRAEVLFRAGIRLDPRHARNHAGLSRVLLSQGFHEAAAQSTELAVQLAPDDAASWLAHGAALARNGRTREALAALERGRGLMPDATRRTVLESARIRRIAGALDFHAARAIAVDAEQRRGRLPLRVVQGLPVVDVAFEAADGGRIEVPMLVDTGGALAILLDDDVTPGLEHDRTGRRQVVGFQDRPTADSGRVAAMNVGDWRFEDVPAVFVPRDPDAPPRPYSGVLGPGLASSRIWVLNFRRQAMAIEDPRDRRSSEPTEGELVLPFRLLGDGKVILSVMVGCEPVLALVDTGSPRSFRSRHLGEARIWGPLGFGDTVMRFPPPPVLPMLDTKVSPVLGAEIGLLLGTDFLMRYGIVTLDYPERTLTLTPRDERRR